MAIWIDLFARIAVLIGYKDAGFHLLAHKDTGDINARNAEHGAAADIRSLVRKLGRIF